MCCYIAVLLCCCDAVLLCVCVWLLCVCVWLLCVATGGGVVWYVMRSRA